MFGVGVHSFVRFACLTASLTSLIHPNTGLVAVCDAALRAAPPTVSGLFSGLKSLSQYHISSAGVEYGEFRSFTPTPVLLPFVMPHFVQHHQLSQDYFQA